MRMQRACIGTGTTWPTWHQDRDGVRGPHVGPLTRGMHGDSLPRGHDALRLIPNHHLPYAGGLGLQSGSGLGPGFRPGNGLELNDRGLYYCLLKYLVIWCIWYL